MELKVTRWRIFSDRDVENPHSGYPRYNMYELSEYPVHGIVSLSFVQFIGQILFPRLGYSQEDHPNYRLTIN